MIVKKTPVAPIITTRGCPYNCSYCSASIISGRQLRFRSPSLVVDEIEMLVNTYGVREIQIEDDNFTLNTKHALEICREIIRRGIKVIWSLPNGVRVDCLTDELLADMRKSGCYLMALGIESGNQRLLDESGKKLDLTIVPDMVNKVRKAGIAVWGFFMIGFPSETNQEVWETINFAL
jgi:radical SAM superfamily enzyme YgiQ (UPF0313 family)